MENTDNHQKIIEKCRKPKNINGAIISYLDCPYVVLSTHNNIRVVSNLLDLDPLNENDRAIIRNNFQYLPFADLIRRE